MEINEGNAVRKAQARYTSSNELKDKNFAPLPHFWISEKQIQDLGNPKKWVIAIRKNTAATNICTLLSSILPNYGLLYSFNILTSDSSNTADLCILLGCLNSFVLDYVVRNKIGGENLAKFIIKQFPIVSVPKNNTKTKRIVIDRVLRLTYNFDDLRAFAHDLNYQGEPIEWNDKERFQLQCELDAIYAHLYGLEKDEMDYILETFPIVKRKDIDKYGSYRTKETILKLYNEFAWVKKDMEDFRGDKLK